MVHIYEFTGGVKRKKSYIFNMVISSPCILLFRFKLLFPTKISSRCCHAAAITGLVFLYT